MYNSQPFLTISVGGDMSLITSIALAALVCAVAYYLIRTFIDAGLIKHLADREQDFQQRNINPAGSSLAHGMCTHKQTNKIHHDQVKSNSWYKKLAG